MTGGGGGLSFGRVNTVFVGILGLFTTSWMVFVLALCSNTAKSPCPTSAFWNVSSASLRRISACLIFGFGGGRGLIGCGDDGFCDRFSVDFEYD